MPPFGPDAVGDKKHTISLFLPTTASRIRLTLSVSRAQAPAAGTVASALVAMQLSPLGLKRSTPSVRSSNALSSVVVTWLTSSAISMLYITRHRVYTSILCVPLTALPSQYERRKHLATSPSLRASLVRLLCTRDAPSELRVLALECLCTATAAEGSMKVRASFLFHHCV